MAKIVEFAAVLGDKAAQPRERLEALRFLVHFVADIHQPFHCADDHDRGGNDIHVSFLGRNTTLHALWDSGLLEGAAIPDERAHAMKLARAIRPADLDGGAEERPRIGPRRVTNGRRRSMESHKRRDRSKFFYEAEFLPVVATQLQKAGVRLANLLNGALK